MIGVWTLNPMAAAISFIELGQEVARVFEACGKDDRLARCALDRVNSAVSVAPALSEVDVSSSNAFQGFTTELANLKTYADKWQRKTYIKKLYGAQKYAQQFDETFRTLDGYTNELNLLVAAKGALNTVLCELHISDVANWNSIIGHVSKLFSK